MRSRTAMTGLLVEPRRRGRARQRDAAARRRRGIARRAWRGRARAARCAIFPQETLTAAMLDFYRARCRPRPRDRASARERERGLAALTKRLRAAATIRVSTARPPRPPGRLTSGMSSIYGTTGKRILDVSLSAAGLALTLPLIFVVALLIRATLGSPILFTQQRPGLRGRPFVLLQVPLDDGRARARRRAARRRSAADARSARGCGS